MKKKALSRLIFTVAAVAGGWWLYGWMTKYRPGKSQFIDYDAARKSLASKGITSPTPSQLTSEATKDLKIPTYEVASTTPYLGLKYFISSSAPIPSTASNVWMVNMIPETKEGPISIYSEELKRSVPISRADFEKYARPKEALL